MIRINDISETPESKTDSLRGYMSINPVERLSDQDVAEYIKREFENARDVASFDTYDKLLSDVFNRSEEEIDIDFTITEKINSLLDSFKPEKWESFNDSERIDLITDLSQAIG